MAGLGAVGAYHAQVAAPGTRPTPPLTPHHLCPSPSHPLVPIPPPPPSPPRALPAPLPLQDEHLSIRQLSALTSIKVEDILSTLQSLHMIKTWKGQHVVSVSTRQIEELLAGNRSAQYFAKPEGIHWAPKPAAKPTKR